MSTSPTIATHVGIPDARAAEPRASRGARALRIAGGILVGLVALAVALAAFGAAMRAQVRAMPAPTGAAPVGRTELALTDAGRPDPFTGDGRPRELAVWIWYPAVAGSTGPAAPYLPQAWQAVADGGFLAQDPDAVRTSAIAGAPMDGRPPVVMLMPGLGPVVANYTPLAEDLASHGYAVVAVNPTGSDPAAFPDGRTVAATAAGSPSGMDVPTWYATAERVTDVWVADLAFAAKTLAADPPAIGDLDFSHVAYVGHSLGGAASFQACTDDPRCAAAVDLDGTLWTPVRHDGVRAPSLLVQAAVPDPCESFCAAAAADFAAVQAKGNLERVVIAGSKHTDFTDLGLMWGPLTRIASLGSIDSGRMTLITRDLVRSFLDEHTGRAPAGTFAAAAAGYAELH
ncbi:MAG: alpha/beta hydrolase [Chloroflexota bacterium]